MGGLLWLNTATNGTHVAAYDGNGSVLGLIGTTGQVTARYEYGPFGELLRMSGDALAADNPWRWGTKRVDPTTDLVHYEYRVYSPRLGRWLSRDPIGEAGGRNLYAFAGNDPVNSQDVLGLDGGAGALSAVTQGLSLGVQSVEVALAANDALRLALWSCACRNKEFWQGLGSGVWGEIKGLWDGARSVLDAATSAPAMMAKPGAGLAMEMAIAVEVHRVMVGLYDMARNAEFLEILKTLVPEIGVFLTQPIASPDWCKALGSLSGSAAFELLTLLLAPELTPAKLAALAGKLGPRIGKAADDVAELIRKARKLIEPHCFVAGTLVATAVGLVPIESIQAGDLVWARDEASGEVRLCEVAETYRRESASIVEVIAGGERIATTPEHPFWVQDHGWRAAGDLQVGDRLVTLGGESVVVEDIRRRPVPEPVYNFKVSGLHTYFVGLGGVWVHNNCDGKTGDLFSPSMVDDFLSRKIESLPDSERVFVIGENQRGRVNPAARSIKAMTATDFWPDEMKFDLPLSAINEAKSIQFNRYLIERLHSEGFRFVDIGPKGAIPTSLWYTTELETLERLGGHAWPWPGSGF